MVSCTSIRALAAFALVFAACVGSESTATPTSEAAPVALPAPTLSGGMALTDAIQQRRSVRSFTDRQLTQAELGQLLWAAQGRTEGRFRAAPSAGALYPLELFVVQPEGVFHYAAEHHSLVRVLDGDRRKALADAALGQASVAEAPTVVAVAAVVERTAAKYGDDAPAYCRMEAGHAVQNLLLQAVALGLGAVPIGAIRDGAFRRVLGLDDGYLPIYVVPVGEAAGSP